MKRGSLDGRLKIIVTECQIVRGFLQETAWNYQFSEKSEKFMSLCDRIGLQSSDDQKKKRSLK